LSTFRDVVPISEALNSSGLLCMAPEPSTEILCGSAAAVAANLTEQPADVDAAVANQTYCVTAIAVAERDTFDTTLEVAYPYFGNHIPCRTGEVIEGYFGKSSDSIVTLFQLMTGEGAFVEIVQPLRSAPVAWLSMTCVAFVVWTVFYVFNIVVSVFVVGLLREVYVTTHCEPMKIVSDNMNDVLEVQAAFEGAAGDHGKLQREEFEAVVSRCKAIKKLGLERLDLLAQFTILDVLGEDALNPEDCLACVMNLLCSERVDVNEMLETHAERTALANVHKVEALLDPILSNPVGVLGSLDPFLARDRAYEELLLAKYGSLYARVAEQYASLDERVRGAPPVITATQSLRRHKEVLRSLSDSMDKVDAWRGKQGERQQHFKDKMAALRQKVITLDQQASKVLAAARGG